jgi:hypothetical protein
VVIHILTFLAAQMEKTEVFQQVAPLFIFSHIRPPSNEHYLQ